MVHKFSMDTIKKRRLALQENGESDGHQSARKYMDFLDILLKARVSS